MRSRLCSFSFLIFVSLAVSGTAQVDKEVPKGGAVSTAAEIHFSLATAKWGPPYNGSEGFPKGARRVTLNTDPKTGGETYYAHFPAGSRFAPHWHGHPEYAVVLRGKAVHILGNERRTMLPGDYVIIPPKTNHGWEADASGDVYLLIRRDGPADFNFVKHSPEAAIGRTTPMGRTGAGSACADFGPWPHHFPGGAD